MDGIALQVVGSLVVVIIIMLAIPKLFGRAARIRRRLRSVEQSTIRQLSTRATSPGRISGIVVPLGGTLIAPLTGRACVFYETRVIRAIGLGAWFDGWDVEYKLASETRSVPFVAEDGTGAMVVDPSRVERHLELDVDRWSRGGTPGPGAEDAFLARVGQRRRWLLFEKRLRFTESIIEVGERIGVMGVAVEEPSANPDGPYRQLGMESKYARLTLSSEKPAIVTDDHELAAEVIND